METVLTGPPGEAPVAKWHESPRLRSPAWGIPLGLLLVIGDALLIPGENGVTVGGKIMLAIAVGAMLATALLTFRIGARMPLVVIGAAMGASLIGFIASGDWFAGASEAPRWRDALVPGIDALFLTTAFAAWYTGRRAGGEVLLVASVTALGMVVYGQQDPFAWAAIAGVVATFLLLVPEVGTVARVTGLVIHALALLGFIQQQESWFAWAAYPFLTLFPIYVIAVYFRETGRPRSIAWWTGAVVGAGMVLLGISTLIGNARRDLPLGESWVLLGIGVLVAGAFAFLRFGVKEEAAPA